MKVTRDVLASLFLAAVCSQDLANSQRTCTEFDRPVFLDGYERPPVGNLTATECRDQCASDSGCVAYWLEADSTTSATATSCTTFSAIKVPYPNIPVPLPLASGRCGSFLRQVNGDIPGNDLKNVPALDAVQCSYACELTPRCGAYSWTNYNGGTCWMKTQMPAATVGPSDGSVISGEVFRCFMERPDTDYRGEDLASVQRADWCDCCGVCRRTRGCIGASWSNYNGGTCWLKKSIKSSLHAPGVMSVSLG